MKIECEIEKYGHDGRRSEHTVLLLGIEQMETLVEALAQEWCASLRLYGDGQELRVCLSSGDCAVFAMLEDGAAVDLVGRAEALGFVGFVEAGRHVERPRRLCVSRGTAKAALKAFAAGLPVDAAEACWEHRRPPSSR
jgi:hypothetical protein